MASKNKTTIIAEPGKQEVIITREFDFPRDMVFKAYTNPALYPQWIGPRGLTTTLEKYEAHDGGTWRFTQKDSNGSEYGFHGVFHEVLAPERIIQSFEFAGFPEKGHVILETLRFEELPGGRTKLVGQSVFQSMADRDGMVQSGMEHGVVESYERLDEILASLQMENN